MRGARRAGVVLLSTLLMVGGLLAPPAGAAAGKETRLAEQLVRGVSVGDANRHLIALQRIASQNGGNRSSQDQTADDPGFRASIQYVAKAMRDLGFQVQVQNFNYEVEVINTDSITGSGLAESIYIDQMTDSISAPVGGITAPLAVVPVNPAGTGCDPSDFAGKDYTGKIALIMRGTCPFSQKATNAAAAGALLAVIYNNAPEALSGTLAGVDVSIPVGGISGADGAILQTQAGMTITVDMNSTTFTRQSQNVIAQTRTGRTDNVIMAGAHLDSVAAGPGINDNGSGSAALLELAQTLGSSPKTTNAIRFGWWGAEELGLIGSTKYVEKLPFQRQLDIAMYLNFDMIGSPNAGYFVYDGNETLGQGDIPAPPGSAQIEQTFVSFFNERLQVQTEDTEFDGRSDYQAFIAAGIPAGGLFTGAEDIKTADQVTLWGGTAGVAYDKCYHQACDTIQNVDRLALERNMKAAAWATGIYGYSTEDINGVPARDKRAQLRAQSQRMSLLAAPDAHDGAAA